MDGGYEGARSVDSSCVGMCESSDEAPNSPRGGGSESLLTRICSIDWKEHAGLFASRFLLSYAVMIFRSSFVLGLKHFYPALPPHRIGYMTSFTGACTVVFGIVVGWASKLPLYVGDEERLQMHAACLFPVSFLVIGTSPNLWVMLAGMAMLSAGTCASRACGVILTTKHSRPDQVGKLLGVSSSILSIARAIAPFTSGMFQEYDFNAPVISSFLVSAAGTLVFYRSVYLRKHKTE